MQDSTRESCSTSVNETINASHLYTITGTHSPRVWGWACTCPATLSPSEATTGLSTSTQMAKLVPSAIPRMCPFLQSSQQIGRRRYGIVCLTLLDQSGLGKHQVIECRPHRFTPDRQQLLERALFCNVYICSLVEKKIIQFMFGFGNTQTNFIMNCAICTFSTHALHSGYKIRKVIVKIKKT